MPVKFNVVALGNPANPDAPKKFYAKVNSSGEITLRALAKEIARESTVSPADVLAVLEGLLTALPAHLSNGEIVRLGDFGSFSLSITSEGQDTEAKVTAKSVKNTKIKFRPGQELKAQLSAIKFEKK